MTAVLDSQVFFIISSVGFVILGILCAILLAYLIPAAKSLSRIMKKLEGDLDAISETTKEIFSFVHSSKLFKFLFKRGKVRLKVKK